jgi:pimeloyl-ACP methyl ester carboxylesterase
MGGRKNASPKHLRWLEYGEPRGLPTFYFHGIPGSEHEAALADQSAKLNDIRLISPDRLNFIANSSSKCDILMQWPEKIIELADSLNIDSFCVIGFSGGTPYAMACAARFPDRVTSLTLASPLAPFHSEAMQQFINPGFKPLYELCISNVDAATKQIDLLADSADALFSLMESSASLSDKRIFQNTSIKQKYIANLAKAVSAGSSILARDMQSIYSPWQFELHDIRAPVTVIHGTEDTNIGVQVSKYLARQFPNLRLFEEIEDAGHFILFDIWDEIFSTLNHQTS